MATTDAIVFGLAWTYISEAQPPIESPVSEIRFGSNFSAVHEQNKLTRNRWQVGQNIVPMLKNLRHQNLETKWVVAGEPVEG